MVFAPFLTTLTLTLLTLPPSTLPHPLSTSPYPLLPHPSDLTCIDSPDWVTPNFLAGDCYTAIDKFRNRDLDAHQGMTLEFLANGYQPFFRTPFMQVTPRRYSYKSCTMVVALLRDLEAGEVVPQSNFPKSDLSTYIFIHNAVLNVLQDCLSPVLGGKGKAGGSGLGFVNPTGYDIAGEYRSIGVFLWDTQSNANQWVPRPGAGPTTNITSAERSFARILNAARGGGNQSIGTS